MFGSCLNYVTMRLIGEGADDGEGAMEKTRKWILDHGGAAAITSWGKCGFQGIDNKFLNGPATIHFPRKYGYFLVLPFHPVHYPLSAGIPVRFRLISAGI
ncbi:hypothetical protein C5167_032541, partial [Papaver somniferum]